jgi:hypothetical protein
MLIRSDRRHQALDASGTVFAERPAAVMVGRV